MSSDEQTFMDYVMRRQSACRQHIRNVVITVSYSRFRWPWVTFYPGFKVTVNLQVEYLTDGARVFKTKTKDEKTASRLGLPRGKTPLERQNHCYIYNTKSTPNHIKYPTNHNHSHKNALYRFTLTFTLLFCVVLITPSHYTQNCSSAIGTGGVNSCWSCWSQHCGNNSTPLSRWLKTVFRSVSKA